MKEIITESHFKNEKFIVFKDEFKDHSLGLNCTLWDVSKKYECILYFTPLAIILFLLFSSSESKLKLLCGSTVFIVSFDFSLKYAIRLLINEFNFRITFKKTYTNSASSSKFRTIINGAISGKNMDAKYLKIK